MTDLLYLIYSEVKRRGGIYKMHADRANEPQTGGLKVYDYLWVGENVENADGLRKATKNHTPYVVPCIQGTSAKVEGESDHFLHSIPYMQFPLLQGGRPLTGERAVIPIPRLPGVQENGFYAAAWKYYQAHPNGPYIYGGWDPIPPNPEMRPAHARWLKQYLPLVEDGTWAYLEIADSDLFATPSARKTAWLRPLPIATCTWSWRTTANRPNRSRRPMRMFPRMTSPPHPRNNGSFPSGRCGFCVIPRERYQR